MSLPLTMRRNGSSKTSALQRHFSLRIWRQRGLAIWLGSKEISDRNARSKDFFSIVLALLSAHPRHITSRASDDKTESFAPLS
jgi:hypothetical protein